MNINEIENILSGNANEFDKKQFNDWLAQSKQNRKLFEKTKILWERVDKVYSHATFDQQRGKININSKINTKRQIQKRHKTRFWVSAAASILLLIGLGITVFYQYNISHEKQYASGKSSREIQLADGSHIWLNSNSSLRVSWNFGKKQREVTLKGEAYFEINRDTLRPFKIHAGQTVTEVLGTSFNVELDTILGNVNVIVKSGKVGFYKASQRESMAVLTPENLASYLNADQSIVVSSNPNLNFLSWKTGILKFYATPIEEVCKTLSKYFHRKVNTRISQPGLVLTGTFENESLEEIINTIELTLDVSASSKNNEITFHK